MLTVGTTIRRKRCAAYGAVLVEYMLGLTLMLLVFFAIIQYGYLVFSINALNHIARETARFTAVHGNETTSDSAYTTSNSIRAEVYNLCMSSPINFAYILNLNTTTGSNQNTGSPLAPLIYQANTMAGQTSVASTYATRTEGILVTIILQYNMTTQIFFKPIVPGLANWGTYTVEASDIMDVPTMQ